MRRRAVRRRCARRREDVALHVVEGLAVGDLEHRQLVHLVALVLDCVGAVPVEVGVVLEEVRDKGEEVVGSDAIDAVPVSKARVGECRQISGVDHAIVVDIVRRESLSEVRNHYHR